MANQLRVWLEDRIASFENRTDDYGTGFYDALYATILYLNRTADEPSDAKDAARYRWLKKHGAHNLTPITWIYPEARQFGTPDEAIDAAMRATEETSDG